MPPSLPKSFNTMVARYRSAYYRVNKVVWASEIVWTYRGCKYMDKLGNVHLVSWKEFQQMVETLESKANELSKRNCND